MERKDYEKNISTQKKKKKKKPRFHEADGHKSRKAGVETKAAKDEEENKRLKVCMLKRIRKDWEFRRVYRQGKALVSRRIVLYYFKNHETCNRLGVSISKKVGNSVKRHRVKRIFGEAFRQMQDSLAQGYDFILVARKPTVKMNYHSAREELLLLCKKGKLLKKE